MLKNMIEFELNVYLLASVCGNFSNLSFANQSEEWVCIAIMLGLSNSESSHTI